MGGRTGVRWVWGGELLVGCRHPGVEGFRGMSREGVGVREGSVEGWEPLGSRGLWGYWGRRLGWGGRGGRD